MLNNQDAYVITSHKQARWLRQYLRGKLGVEELAVRVVPDAPRIGGVSIFMIVAGR